MQKSTCFSNNLKQVQHSILSSGSDQSSLAVTHLLHISRIFIYLVMLCI
jgi:hypothetical protein